MSLDEVTLIWLKHKMLIDLLSFNREESTDLFNFSVLSEYFCIFKFVSEFRVVSH